MEDYAAKMFALYAQTESYMSNLYDLYARTFPEERAFWARLSDEEAKHAKWVTELAKATEKHLVSFEEGELRTKTLESFLTVVAKIKGLVEKGEITHAKAIAYAIDLERTFIEREVFSHFKADTEGKMKALKKLEEETARHSAELVELSRKYSA